MKIKNNKSNSSYNNSKQKEKRTPKIIGLGLIKLDFYLNITDDLIKHHNIELSKINSPKDLFFIAENPILLDLVQLSTTDTLTNILLYVNKANSQKSFVELITLNPLRFKPEEEFIRKIFSHVTEHNYLFTNEMNVASTPNKISFAIKSGKKLLKYFDIIADYDPFAEEIKKEENFIVNKSFKIDEKDAIKEEDENAKNFNTNSNLNLTQNDNNVSKNNNYDNFNNNENNRNADMNEFGENNNEEPESNKENMDEVKNQENEANNEMENNNEEGKIIINLFFDIQI